MVQAQSLRGFRELVTDLGGTRPGCCAKTGVDPAPSTNSPPSSALRAKSSCWNARPRTWAARTSGCAWPNAKTLASLTPWPWPCVTRPPWVRPCAAPPNTSTSTTPPSPSPSAPGSVGARPSWCSGSWSSMRPRWAQTAEHGIGLAWRIMTLLSEGRCHLQQVWLPHPAVAPEGTYDPASTPP